jgi:hypothetical protein
MLRTIHERGLDMRCPIYEKCKLFMYYNHQMTDIGYQYLVKRYCDGDLYSECKRIEWQNEKADPVSNQLLPHGILIHSGIKAI